MLQQQNRKSVGNCDGDGRKQMRIRNVGDHLDNIKQQHGKYDQEGFERGQGNGSPVSYFLNLFYNRQNDSNSSMNNTVQKVDWSIDNNRNQSYRQPPSPHYLNPYSPHLHSQSHPQPHSHTLTYIIAIAILSIILIILYFDIRSQYRQQLHKLELQSKQCLRMFMENQCDQPVQILEEECNRLKLCYHQNVKNKVKISVVVSRVFSHVFKSFVEELGYISLGVFLILVAIFVWRPNFNGQANGIGRGRDNEGGNKIL